MRKIAGNIDMKAMVLLTAMFAVLGQVSTAVAAKQESEDTGIVAPAYEKPSAESAVRAPSNCGGMEFDRNSGRMIRRPNVDLIVSHMEIIRNDRGTWVRPTIENRCPGVVSGEIHVSIGEVVLTALGLPGNSSHKLGAVGVAVSESHTAVVDYDRQIPESNEHNNRCTRSTTGGCP